MTDVLSILSISTICALLGSATNIAGERTERPRINASDVVFMYTPSDPTQYDAYAGTVAGWGGRPRTHNAQDVEGFRQRVAEAQRRGVRYCASVDFLVDFGGFIDFRPDNFMDAVCRDLDGNPIRVPWLWDHKHKGHPAYWFCTNNPDYQAYLRDQVQRACSAPIDGLHIDDYAGTSSCSAWNGGCFCPHCKQGFREYLRQRLSPDELKQKGVERIDEFDYQMFLKSRGVTAEQFRKERGKLPLGDVFQRFQNERMKQTVGGVFEFAEKLRGKPLVRSVNSSASAPQTLIVSPLIDYFCGEVGHHAGSAQAPVEPAFVFRMVEALGRRQTATAGGHDWAWIKANEKPGLVRTWIAQAYAFGSAFMVPHNQWCYTEQLGTHWWKGKPEDFAYLYRFVRERAALLDGCVSFANTALVYSNANFGEIRNAALELTRANVPFAIVVAGDDELPLRLTAESIAPYDYLLTGANPLSGEQQQVIQKSSAHVAPWKGLAQLPDAIKKQVVVNGSDRVRVSLRCKPNAPLVCHVLNQNYDKDKDDVQPVDVQITLNGDLLKKDAREAIIHAPQRDPVRAPMMKNGDAMSFEVKGLGLWAVVEVKEQNLALPAYSLSDPQLSGHIPHILLQ